MSRGGRSRLLPAATLPTSLWVAGPHEVGATGELPQAADKSRFGVCTA
jgi:hypothetical protein